MNDRLKLQEELQGIIGVREDGHENVYFQPPESIKQYYPCVRYYKQRPRTFRADNKSYVNHQGYQLFVIEKDPDSDLVSRITDHFQYVMVDRSYTSNNLYHTVLSLFY